MTIADNLRDWYRRTHVRVHDRPAGTNGPDDLGAHGGCTCPTEIDTQVIGEARQGAARVHAKFEHPGPPDHCQSPHDVLCKAAW